MNSDRFDGLSSSEARDKIGEFIETKELGQRVTNFKIKDWGLSRQRYWGAPIPMIHLNGRIIPALDLPVTLPYDVTIDGRGNPLERHERWKMNSINGQQATRECDTLDTFFQSSWYFLRFMSENPSSVPFLREDLNYWKSVDIYIGGIEHAILHLLYARFFTKVLRDLGIIDIDEPFLSLVTQGMVLKDGSKMSKSKGNIVEPVEIINKYGADSARLFILFANPPTKELEWSDEALEGAYRFINRLYDRANNISTNVHNFNDNLNTLNQLNLNEKEKFARRKIYESLAKNNLTFNSKDYPFNTLIASCMEALNAISAQENEYIYYEGYYILLHILEGIIPHVASELSQKYFNLANFKAIKIDEKIIENILKVDILNIAITINGKRRGEIQINHGDHEKDIKERAKIDVKRFLENKEIIKEIYIPNKLINLVVN